MKASYYGGAWDTGKFQITTAHGDATHGLGWADNGSNVTVMYTLYGDGNLDGTVNGADLTTVLSNYNQHLVGIGAAVPEPSTLLLAAAGLMGLLAYAQEETKVNVLLTLRGCEFFEFLPG